MEKIIGDEEDFPDCTCSIIRYTGFRLHLLPESPVV